jgi:hypothetical protein
MFISQIIKKIRTVDVYEPCHYDVGDDRKHIKFEVDSLRGVNLIILVLEL